MISKHCIDGAVGLAWLSKDWLYVDWFYQMATTYWEQIVTHWMPSIFIIVIKAKLYFSEISIKLIHVCKLQSRCTVYISNRSLWFVGIFAIQDTSRHHLPGRSFVIGLKYDFKPTTGLFTKSTHPSPIKDKEQIGKLLYCSILSTDNIVLGVQGQITGGTANLQCQVTWKPIWKCITG